MLKSLEAIVEEVKKREKRTVSVAYGQDLHTLQAIEKGVKEGLFNAIVFASKAEVERIANANNIDISLFEIVDVPEEDEAIRQAVRAVRQKRADLLMKGLCHTANYMRGILNKEEGLLPPGAVLSHAFIIEIPTYHKLMVVSDAAVIPQPDLNMKKAMINYNVAISHKLGIDNPKVAVIAAVETVNPKMQATVDGALLSKMNERNQIKGCIVDGPLALDLAVSKESAEIKKVRSEVAGDADILIFPNIETGNAFYKCTTKLGNAKVAGIVTGTTAPAVLTSRGDSEDSKFLSLALAALIAEK